MELEEALDLKAGTTVVAGFTNANPAITGGKSYTLRADAIPVYESNLHGARQQPGEKPCHCYFSIEDDHGQPDRMPYILFRVI